VQPSHTKTEYKCVKIVVVAIASQVLKVAGRKWDQAPLELEEFEERPLSYSTISHGQPFVVVQLL